MLRNYHHQEIILKKNSASFLGDISILSEKEEDKIPKRYSNVYFETNDISTKDKLLKEKQHLKKYKI